MPTIRQITLPDGVTYDLAATAENRERVQIITEYSGSETTFNALEVTKDSLGRTFYNINSPAGNPIFQWVWDGASELQFLNGSISVGGTLMPYGGESFSNGGQYFENSTALPAQTAAASYNVLCIDSFASGGRTKYCAATSSATGNTIVTRHKDGYIYATYFNQSSGAENPASFTSYAPFFSSDGFLRKSSKANFTTWLGFKWSGQTTVPNWLWGGNANNDWAVYSPHVIAGLKYLGHIPPSSTAKNFTINSYCTEIVIAGSFSNRGTVKLFTSSAPKNLLSKTTVEVWLGGGKGEDTSSVAAAAARCVCNVTLVNSTTVQVQCVASNNESISTTKATTLYVYQR